jgi:LuxR family transcriptional regulator, maltose regulon positive regulatory protein
VSNTGPGVTPGGKEEYPSALEPGRLLLRTKFYAPPKRGDQIARPRLLELMNSGLDKALILVSAPAGYGKTTLVSSWLNAIKLPSAWLSLDGGDNDPMRLFQYLLGTLVPLVPGIEADLFGMLQAVPPVPFDTMINCLVNGLVANFSPLVLVLDDFHVIHSEITLKIFSYLLEHLPPQMHLVIITRTDPPLPLSRLRVRNQLLDIRADRLRFTQAETAAFLNDAMGLTLTAGDLAAMETRTEGWIAGLQLAALSMQGCKDIHGFVSAFTGSHHYVMDYLAEEVLKLQPKEVTYFLLLTSILDCLCGPLCEAVAGPDATGPVDGQAMLEALEEMNLFVLPLDDQRHWYRYHHLFTDVLRKRLEQQFPGLLPELHRRASIWYEQNAFLAESIQESLSAGDKDRAARLIEQNGCLLLISGEVTTLLNWANAIEFQSEAHPWLAIQKAWALALTGDLDRVEPTLAAPEKLLSPLEPTVEVRTMRGTIAAARAHLANSRGDTQSAAEFARDALGQLPDCSEISQSIRSVATSILGDASWINGNLEEASRAYAEAVRIGREAGNLHMVIIANSNLGDILLEQGQLGQAAETYIRALQLAVRPDGQRSPLAGKLYAGMGRIAYARDQLGDADKYIHQCIDLCRQWGDIELQAIANAMLARLEHIRGNAEAAREAIRRAEQLAGERPLSPRRSIQLDEELARFWLAQGNLGKLSQRVQKSSQAVEDRIPYQREPEYVIWLRELLARNDGKTAMPLSERLLEQAESAGRMSLVLEILILQALAFQRKKDSEHAQTALERALALAQAEGYVRPFLEEGDAMTRLLCQVQTSQVGSGYAAELLARIGQSKGMTQPSMQLLTEPLTAREVEVLRLIEAGCSNQDIAGRLVISIPTVKRHISNIYSKLDAKSRTQAVAIGKELKILD